MKTVYKITTSCNSRLARKDKHELRTEVVKSLNRLSQKINTYSQSGIEFNQIFNDDSIKYDIIHNEFSDLFTYKHHGRNNSQLRILYFVQTCIVDGIPIIIITLVDFVEKRNSTNQKQNHLAVFANYKNVNLKELATTEFKV